MRCLTFNLCNISEFLLAMFMAEVPWQMARTFPHCTFVDCVTNIVASNTSPLALGIKLGWFNPFAKPTILTGDGVGT